MFALEFLRAPVWQGLTWTLLHFLWEGLAVAVMLMLLLRLCGVRRSRIRYLLCLSGMATMVLCPIVTFLVLAGDADWGAADWGAGQARSTPIAEAAVDLGPSLPLEAMMDTFAASHTVAPLPPPPVVTASESRLWDRLGEYGRDAQPYLLAAWVIGVVCLSVRLLLGVVAARWLRRAREAIPPPLADSVSRLSRAMGLRSAARVCMSSRIREAMLVGILRPMVLLPAAWATEMTPEILEAIIAHELAHIRRWDLWATLFQRLVETLLFYHPAVWWISRQMSSEREKCCDELAVAATGQRVTYAKALEKAAAIRLAPTASVLGAAFGGRKMAILDRVSHVLGMSVARKNEKARWWPVGLLALLMLVGIYRVAFETPSAVLAEEKPVATPLQSTDQTKKPRKKAAATFIRGTVVDQQGKPIGGARLWHAYAFDKSSGKRLEVDARSDATGRFTLEIPPVPAEKEGFVRNVYSNVWAYSPEHCLGSAFPKSKKASQDPAGIRIELVPATDTSLVVLDPDGQPTAGVLVEPINYLTQRYYVNYDLIPDGAKPFVGGRTDAEGRVRLPAMARDHLFRIWLTTDNYGVQSQQFTVKASEPAERTIHLRPVCRLEGRVVAEKPEWAIGRRFFFTTGQPGHWSTEGNADVTTDKEGRFVVPIIAEGQLRMQQVVLDDKLPVRPEQPSFVKLSAGKTTVLEIPMRRLVDIRGSILAKDTGKPLPGIEIHVYYGQYRQGTDVVSDVKGQFAARVLPGRVSFQPQSLSKTKYLQLGEPQWHNVPDDADGLELPAIEVVPSKPLDGRLVDSNDSPVADAKISASYAGWLCSTAPTGKDGRFKLPKMPVSVDSDKATYRVNVIGETLFLYNGPVEIIQVDPFILRMK